MTVVGIRDAGGAGGVEVMFGESARFFRLLREHPDYGGLIEQLQNALEQNARVRVCCKSFASDLIEDVRSDRSS